MAELFETKIRKVGTSFGILIPKEIIESERLRNGETVKLAIIKILFGCFHQMLLCEELQKNIVARKLPTQIVTFA